MAAGCKAGDTWGGLVRAFLRAGRSLLVSLWPINDLASLTLAVPFCAALKDGLTVPQALRDVDWPTMNAWSEEIADKLPAEEQDAFLELWRPLLPELAFWPHTARPFKKLELWAPYLAIGWPGPLPGKES